MSAPFKFDPAEEFENLRVSPAIEAVIGIRARSSCSWEKESVLKNIPPWCLDGEYTLAEEQHLFSSEVKLNHGGPCSSEARDLGLNGLRFRSKDEKNVAQFNRDGFAFSRLEPYVNWDEFYAEAMRLRAVYWNAAKPKIIEQLGVRYINKIPMSAEDLALDHYLDPAPQPPKNMVLPLMGFLHLDTLAVPEQPYNVTVIRTLKPRPGKDSQPKPDLILDIDVKTNPGTQIKEQMLEEHLVRMRYLKNKTFYGFIAPKALESFK